MNNEALEILGKINANIREAKIAINKKKEHDCAIWFYKQCTIRSLYFSFCKWNMDGNYVII